MQVTGTRIQNPNVTSANPITSISGDEMRQLGFVNVADVMTQLVPQNLSTYMPTMVGDDQAGSGGGACGGNGGNGGFGNPVAGQAFTGSTAGTAGYSFSIITPTPENTLL